VGVGKKEEERGVKMTERKGQIKTNLGPTRGEIISLGGWGRAERTHARGEREGPEMKKSEYA